MGDRLGSKFDAPSTQLSPNAVKCENLRELNQNVQDDILDLNRSLDFSDDRVKLLQLYLAPFAAGIWGATAVT